jgi:hypothetical protein
MEQSPNVAWDIAQIILGLCDQINLKAHVTVGSPTGTDAYYAIIALSDDRMREKLNQAAKVLDYFDKIERHAMRMIKQATGVTLLFVAWRAQPLPTAMSFKSIPGRMPSVQVVGEDFDAASTRLRSKLQERRQQTVLSGNGPNSGLPVVADPH